MRKGTRENKRKRKWGGRWFHSDGPMEAKDL